MVVFMDIFMYSDHVNDNLKKQERNSKNKIKIKLITRNQKQTK